MGMSMNDLSGSIVDFRFHRMSKMMSLSSSSSLSHFPPFFFTISVCEGIYIMSYLIVSYHIISYGLLYVSNRILNSRYQDINCKEDTFIHSSSLFDLFY